MYAILKGHFIDRYSAFGSLPFVESGLDFDVCGDVGFWIEKVARGGSESALNWHSALFLKRDACGTIVETIAIKFRLKAKAIDGVVDSKYGAFEKGVS